MMTFKVNVRRTAYRHATLVIEAADPIEAAKEARNRLSNDKVEWSSETDADTEVDGVFSDEPQEPMPPRIAEMQRLIRLIDSTETGPQRDGYIAAFEALENQQ